ncbi:unnamed protein product, partial [Amoebophrya sp. A120]
DYPSDSPHNNQVLNYQETNRDFISTAPALTARDHTHLYFPKHFDVGRNYFCVVRRAVFFSMHSL